ncbi:replication-relaxation family protein [Kitasatospora sp. NBC_01246]|uniref:replication-relaxation family protein n=1 Tax=Kitasatospora sp. NBC_01246 TaxID=2903570 RepID=UPI003FA551A3
MPEVYHRFGEGPGGTVIPDGLLHYSKKGPDRVLHRAFVEVDRGTMASEKLASKLIAYARFHDHHPVPAHLRRTSHSQSVLPAWQQRYPAFPPPAVRPGRHRRAGSPPPRARPAGHRRRPPDGHPDADADAREGRRGPPGRPGAARRQRPGVALHRRPHEGPGSCRAQRCRSGRRHQGVRRPPRNPGCHEKH